MILSKNRHNGDRKNILNGLLGIAIPRSLCLTYYLRSRQSFTLMELLVAAAPQCSFLLRGGVIESRNGFSELLFLEVFALLII